MRSACRSSLLCLLIVGIATSQTQAGDKIRLVEIESYLAPANTVQMSYSADYARLFLRNAGNLLRVIDTSAHVQTSMAVANGMFADMHLTSDGQYLYASDHSSDARYDPPEVPNHVRRYHLPTGTWETRLAPTNAYKVEPISADQFALLSYGGILTLNTWGDTIIQTYSSSISSVLYQGDIEYHAATQRVINAHTYYPGVTGLKLTALDTLEAQDFGDYTKGDTCVLSSDGSNFYFGKQQVDGLNSANGRLLFAESIYAASADLAFGKHGYYEASTGRLLGSLGFATTTFALDAEGAELWAYDPATELLHRYAIVPEPSTLLLAVPLGWSLALAAGRRRHTA